jgi:hypothetical protein
MTKDSEGTIGWWKDGEEGNGSLDKVVARDGGEWGV